MTPNSNLQMILAALKSQPNGGTIRPPHGFGGDGNVLPPDPAFRPPPFLRGYTPIGGVMPLVAPQSPFKRNNNNNG